MNAVLAALAWTRLELCHAVQDALECFSMANVKLKSFLELVLLRLFDWDGLDRTLRKYPEALLELGQIEPQTHLNRRRIRNGLAAAIPVPVSPQPQSGPPGREPLPMHISKTVHTIGVSEWQES